jgi:hypothetical protein
MAKAANKTTKAKATRPSKPVGEKCVKAAPETAESASEPELPSYREGCPKCHDFPPVTEQKVGPWRVCRCRSCGWRGEMVS